jgi:hypothetical protein
VRPHSTNVRNRRSASSTKARYWLSSRKRLRTLFFAEVGEVRRTNYLRCRGLLTQAEHPLESCNLTVDCRVTSALLLARVNIARYLITGNFDCLHTAEHGLEVEIPAGRRIV